MVSGDHRDEVVHKAMAKWNTDYPYQGPTVSMHLNASRICMMHIGAKISLRSELDVQYQPPSMFPCDVL